MHPTGTGPLVAIACGGTGGHLFPGLAVGESLQAGGAEVVLLISGKAVDQQVVQSIQGLRVVTLEAVGWERGRLAGFVRGFYRAYRECRLRFHERRPDAVLTMGGFTGAPAVLALKLAGATAFLHEANALPGRANRWLAHVVDQAFVYFDEAAGRLWHQRVEVTGMPVRDAFRQPVDVAACRIGLGLSPNRPTLLVTGGSQGAVGLNDLVLRVLPTLKLLEPDLQFIHLAGELDCARVRQTYFNHGLKAVVRPFLTEMELALGAATVMISRAGASSLAEAAAMRVPALLVPYPAAADDHQSHNARAFADTGAARWLRQQAATSETLLWELRGLLREPAARATMRQALARWDFPNAAGWIARRILATGPATVPPTAPAQPPAQESDQEVGLSPLGVTNKCRLPLPSKHPIET